MTSLPISNKTQPSGNTANALQANTAADTQLAGTQPIGPFAFLLAQQIGEDNLFVPDTVATIAIGGNAADGGADRALKDAQEQAVTDTPSDPANALAAILMQIPPPEDRVQKTDDRQATQQPLAPSSLQKTDDRQATQQPLAPSSLQKTDDRQATQQPLAPSSLQKTDDRQATQQPLAPSSLQKTDDRQATQPFIPDTSRETGHKKPASDSKDSQIIQLPFTGNLPSEAAKHVELPSNQTLPASNTAQAIASPAMPAAMAAMLTNNMPASTPLTITTPLGNNGWADEFSQKISWISTQQNQIAELHLNPPNLGPLDVVLKISDNQATVLFTSPHGAVRDAVENAMPKLREILADNGIMLGNATISDQSPRDRGTDSFMNRGSGSPGGVSGTASESAELSPAAAQTTLARRHNGMVDTYA